MLRSTLSFIRCPAHDEGSQCGGELLIGEAKGLDSGPAGEISSGLLICAECGGSYPILAGVAVLVPDVESYLAEHIKGISRAVDKAEIPAAYRPVYLEALQAYKEEWGDGEIVEHIEEDLESERVNSLYFMNHYLRVQGTPLGQEWWLPSSPLMDELIRRHWDHGPFAVIREWVAEIRGQSSAPLSAIELGCGVGGLAHELSPSLGRYLGIDGSFASILLARHLRSDAEARGRVAIPSDLFYGPLARKVSVPGSSMATGQAQIDFVVGDLQFPPAVPETWDLAIALNALDMLDEPESLPRSQRRMLKPSGHAVQSCPYIWHERVAAQIRARLREGGADLDSLDSMNAAREIYRLEGLKTVRELGSVPWLFFKHLRQLEIYSAHVSLAVPHEHSVAKT